MIKMPCVSPSLPFHKTMTQLGEILRPPVSSMRNQERGKPTQTCLGGKICKLNGSDDVDSYDTDTKFPRPTEENSDVMNGPPTQCAFLVACADDGRASSLRDMDGGEGVFYDRKERRG